MPIHDLGYRAWRGAMAPQIGRFWVIAQTGIRLAWRSQWLRRVLFVSWLPAVYFATLLWAYETYAASRGLHGPGGPHEAAVPWLAEISTSATRHQVWATLLWVFFRYPQMIVIIFVVGQIAPPLVAQDVRTKAFLLYFSRPLARFEYVLGKMAVVWFYVLMISAVPALALYLLGVLLAPNLSVVVSTWDLPLRILGASALLMIPMAAVALAISSLTSEIRYAMFGWFALWSIGWVTWSMLRWSSLPALANPHRWDFVSLYHTLGTVQYWVFGLKHELAERWLPMASKMGLLPASSQVDVWPAAVETIVVTVVALAIVYRRVSSPMRI